jgi:hypothetical protein
VAILLMTSRADAAGELDDRTKTAFAAAEGLIKQLITLSTAIVTFVIGFRRDVVGDATSEQIVVASAATSMLLSIVCGLLALGALTGALAGRVAPEGGEKTLDASASRISWRSIHHGQRWAVGQWVLFAFGLVLGVIALWLGLL